MIKYLLFDSHNCKLSFQNRIIFLKSAHCTIPVILTQNLSFQTNLKSFSIFFLRFV